MHRRAFTLIEVLVVLALVGILAGLLVPAMQGVRAASRTTVCAGQLRQVGMAIDGYADDYRGILVPARSQVAGVYWYAQLAAYSIQEKTYSGWGGYAEIRSKHDVIDSCPEYATLRRGVADSLYQDGVGYGFTTAPHLPVASTDYSGTNWDPGFASTDPAAVAAGRALGQTWILYREFRLAQITEPSKRLLCSDHYGSYLGMLGWQPSVIATYRDGPYNNRTGTAGAGFQRHRGAANYVFADLHVGRQTLAQARTSYSNPAALNQ